jgi:hypothetical protein
MSRLTTPTIRVLIAALPFAALAAPADALASSIPVPPPASFGELVAMMPADAVSADGATITYTDMTLLWERIGATDEAARLDSFGELAVRETFGITPQLFDDRFAQVDESEAEVGFNVTHIERELAVIAPPRRIVIDVTSVSPGTIDAAIESNPVWAERVTRVDTDHGSYVDWGDGTEIDPTATSPFRPLGQAGQFAMVGDPATTVRTIVAADAEAVLATAAGASDSAMTTDFLGAIGEVLAHEVVMQAMIQPGATPFAPPIDVSPELIEALLDDAVLVQPYLGIAVVEIADDDGSRTDVILVYPDEASAGTSAPFVEEALASGLDVGTQQPLADLLPGASVTVDGVTVRVGLPEPGSFAQAIQMLQRRSLFPS